MKKIAPLLIAIRLIALTALYFICFTAVSAWLLRTPSDPSDSAGAGAALAALFAVSFLNAVVFAYLILRSRWAGWKLILTIFLVSYGVTTVMPQIETGYFLTGLPPGMLARLFQSGAIVAVLFSPLAVLILGKRTAQQTQDEKPRFKWAPVEWVARILLIVVAHIVIYFTFGYFIAWKSVAVRAYYRGNDPGSFLAQMSVVLRDTPWLLPLQAVRALLWVAIAVPVICMMKGHWWQAGLAVALLFGGVMTAPLLLPNPFMPREVRMVHLLETASSNFLFGWLLVLVLHPLIIWRDK